MTPVAIVAGAGGAGRATAVALAARGFHLVLLDTSADAAAQAALDVAASGGTAEAHSVDLLDVSATQALRDDVVGRLGRVDTLVHLVGGWRGSKGVDVQAVDNWAALNPPIVGTLAVLTAVFNDDIAAAPSGRAFMVTSTAAARPTAGNAAYAAAKSAAEAWMGALAHQWRDSTAVAVVIAVKALLTDAMKQAEPEREFPGYTHVEDLAAVIAEAASGSIENGVRIDMTAAGYSPA